MASEDKPPNLQDAPPLAVDVPADSPPDLPPTQLQAVPPTSTDRTELLQRARVFLTSPQVRHEDITAKQRFLVDKGLSDVETDGLLREVVRHPRSFFVTYYLKSLQLATACPASTTPDIS